MYQDENYTEHGNIVISFGYNTAIYKYIIIDIITTITTTTSIAKNTPGATCDIFFLNDGIMQIISEKQNRLTRKL